MSSESAPPRQSSTDTIEHDTLDAADMARLASGHDAALNDLMDRHAGRLFNFLLRSLGNDQDAADLAQDTFVRVYQHRDRFNPSKKFSTWLFAIATNLVKDRYRYRSRHPQSSIDAETDSTGTSLLEVLPEGKPSADAALEAKERASMVRNAVASLPEELRLPVILSEYEERSHAEIGEILGCTPKAVETRLYRARQLLRTALARLL